MAVLNQVVRSIITHPKEVFFRDLKETLSNRFESKLDEKYQSTISCFFCENKQKEEKLEIKEEVKILKEKEVKTILNNLKESYFDNKTILHKFKDGNTIAITPEDSFSLIQMHDNLNIMNQEKMRNLMSESFAEYNKILKFSKKHRKD